MVSANDALDLHAAHRFDRLTAGKVRPPSALLILWIPRKPLRDFWIGTPNKNTATFDLD
jgi:hypothetical protein